MTRYTNSGQRRENLLLSEALSEPKRNRRGTDVEICGTKDGKPAFF